MLRLYQLTDDSSFLGGKASLQKNNISIRLHCPQNGKLKYRTQLSMILKKEISSQFAMLNLAQTFFWNANHIAKVVDTKIAMDKIGAVESERDGSEPPIFRALRELKPEG